MKKLCIITLFLIGLLGLGHLWRVYCPLPLLGEDTTVAFLFPPDPDPSLTAGVNQAINALSLDWEQVLVYSPEEGEDGLKQAFLSAEKEKAGVIFCLDPSMEGEMLAQASRYPRGEFFCLAGNLAESAQVKNAHDLSVPVSYPAYALGAAAGESTKNGELALLLGEESDLSLLFCEGFFAGAKGVNPDIRLTVGVEAGETPLSSAETALALLDNGGDVFCSLTGDEEGMAAARAAGVGQIIALAGVEGDITLGWDLSQVFVRVLQSPRGEKRLPPVFVFSHEEGVWWIDPLTPEVSLGLTALEKALLNGEIPVEAEDGAALSQQEGLLFLTGER